MGTMRARDGRPFTTQPRPETNGQRTGVDRQRMDRDRLFSHEQLSAALRRMLAPKVKA